MICKMFDFGYKAQHMDGQREKFVRCVSYNRCLNLNVSVIVWLLNDLNLLLLLS